MSGTLPPVPSEWLGSDGMINDDGRRMLAALIEKMPPSGHQLENPRPDDPDIFAIYMRKAKTAAAVEAILHHRGKLLLTYRSDRYWHGWHFPGSYIGKGERFEDALNRCTQRELGMSVRVKGMIGAVNHPNSVRFHDISNLFLCEPSDPQAVDHTFNNNPAWMDPETIRVEDLIPPHRPYLSMIRACLAGTANFAQYADIAE